MMNTFSPDDPKLTAYALGELEPEARAEIEAALRDDPAAQALVAEIRAMGSQLEAALAAEAASDPAAVPSSAPFEAAAGVVTHEPARVVPFETGKKLERAAIINGSDPRKLDGGPLGEYSREAGSKLLRFPQLYFVIGGVAAAGFAVMTALRTPPPVAEVRHYRTIRLSPPAASLPAKSMEEATDVVVGGPVAVGGNLPAADALTFDDRLNLLNDVKSLAPTRSQASASLVPSVNLAQLGPVPEATSIRAKTAARSQPVSMSGAAPVVLAITAGQPVMLSQSGVTGRSRTYFYPPDEKFVVPIQPDIASADRGMVIRPVPKWYSSPRPFPMPPGRGFDHGSRSLLPENFGAAVSRAEGPSGFLGFSPDRSFSGIGSGGLVEAESHGHFVPFGPLDLFIGPRPTRRESRSVPANTESYAFQRDNAFVSAAHEPLSTFAVDVDTASYANIRRFIETGRLPPPDAVRIEELLNYFSYDYPAPPPVEPAKASKDSAAPLAASLEVAEAPWGPTHRLVRIGLKAREVAVDVRPAATLVNGARATVAKDVKLQVDFNPARVASYRLIGYENRMLAATAFNHDKVDGGEIGAGQAVTALYEIVPVGAADAPLANAPAVDPSKYAAAGAPTSGQPAQPEAHASASGELLTVRVRYKEPNENVSQRIDFALTDTGGTFADASADFKFAAAVAEFGMMLRQSPYRGKATIADVIAWAAAGGAHDPHGYRRDFIDLARRTQPLLQ